MNKNAATCEDICYSGLKVRVIDESKIPDTVLNDYKKQGFLYVIDNLFTTQFAHCSLERQNVDEDHLITIRKDNLEPILTFNGKEITCEDICYKGMPVIVTDTSIIPPEYRDEYAKNNMMWVIMPFHRTCAALVSVYKDDINNFAIKMDDVKSFTINKDDIIPAILDDDILLDTLDRKIVAKHVIDDDIGSIRAFEKDFNKVKSF